MRQGSFCTKKNIHYTGSIVAADQERHQAKRRCFLLKQVLRLEGRTRALEESAAAGGGPPGSNGGAEVKDGLTQARVALALKRASAKRQQDIVKTMRSEVPSLALSLCSSA